MFTHIPLSGCVTSLQSSISLLSSSIAILDSKVNDFPRLTKVLQTDTVRPGSLRPFLCSTELFLQHFHLLPESALTNAQSTLLSTITPELNSLLSRVESHLDKLARREQSLIAKYELQEGRLSGSHPTRSVKASAFRSSRLETGDEEEDREKERLRQIKRKKERLSYTVERLKLEAGQRERELKMSVAGR
jgi:DASH complex subunit SPC19